MQWATSSNWHQLCTQLGIVASAGDATWQQIEAAYTAADRHYHHLRHLEAMFAILADLPLVHGTSVALAVWFHDLIYDVRRQDNEAQSAEAALRFGQAQALPSELLQQVEALILSTAGHSPRWDHPDCQALLDADLAILARPAAAYDAYAEAIRQEYRRYPTFLYKKGRRKVLRSFLDRPQLYFTPHLQAQWEGPARANLARELHRWGG